MAYRFPVQVRPQAANFGASRKVIAEPTFRDANRAHRVAIEFHALKARSQLTLVATA